MRNDVDRRFLVFAWATILVSLGAFIASALLDAPRIADGPQLVVAFWLIGFFALLSEWLAVALPVNNISLSYPLSIAAVMLLGPTQAGLLAAASQLPSLFGSKRISPTKAAFNASQLGLSALAAGWVYVRLNGPLLVPHSVSLLSGNPPPQVLLALARLPLIGSVLAATGDVSHLPVVVLVRVLFLIPPIVGVSAVGLLVNFTLTGVAVGLLQHSRLRRVWPVGLVAVAPTQFALGLVGVTMAQVVGSVGIQGLLLFVIPLFVARSTYHRYAQVQDAYAGTIRSLVAAIEAKDTYTKGHSVRVAHYSVSIARHMGMSERSIQRLEYAALLHDLGKVGISHHVLSKAGRLTSAERVEIETHPEVGAHIIDSVPYLEDLVPIVRHHHERYDGRGYGHALRGDAIPMAARIMAVADAYDAMTSHRPYRQALDHEVAMNEVRAGSGTQFDAAVVRAFERVVEAGDAPMPQTATVEPVMSRA